MSKDQEIKAIGVKAILVGSGKVGKTSLIKQIVTNTFSHLSMQTTSFEYLIKTFKIPGYENIDLNMAIWDTAGQEKYRSLAKIYFKGAQIGIFVYDITNKDSFDELKKFWMKQINDEANKNMILAIAGNKCDLENEEVTEEEATALADEVKARFFLTSAKENIGVKELFEYVGKVFLDNHKDEIGKANGKGKGKGKGDKKKLLNEGKDEESGCC